MIDAHVSFCEPYSKELLWEYVQAAQEKGMSELTILEPTHKFLECEPLYKEIRATYPCQERWYRELSRISLQEYHSFITEMKQETFPITIKFGLCVSYVTQHEAWIRKLKKGFAYDVFVGCIEFIDNIAYAWKDSSYEMLWDKYNTNFLYRRYYEMMNALITSDLFNGVAGFDQIKVLQVQPSFRMKHTFHKLARLLKERDMYVEHDSSMSYRYHHADNGLQDEFLLVCKELDVEVKRVSNATCAKDIGRAF